MDPDDLLRRDGAEALRAAVGRGTPLLDLLWERGLAANDRGTPERAAQFEKDLFIAVDQIADGTVRNHYRAALRVMMRELFLQAPPAVRRNGTVRPTGNWRVGQPGKALLGAMAATEAAATKENQLREEGCYEDL